MIYSNKMLKTHEKLLIDALSKEARGSAKFTVPHIKHHKGKNFKPSLEIFRTFPSLVN